MGATLPVTNLFVSGAFGGKTTHVKQQISIDFLLNESPIQSIFLVIPHLCYDIILGSDWLDANHAIIDFESKQFRVRNENICELKVSFSTVLPTSYMSINVMHLELLTTERENYPATQEESAPIEAATCFEAGDNARFVPRSADKFEEQVREKIDVIDALDDKQKEQLRRLVLEFRDAFPTRPGDCVIMHVVCDYMTRTR